LLNSGTAISVATDSVLIEKSYFKNLGSTFLIGIDILASSSNVEIRSNLFLTSGINSGSHGIHVLANTFVGTMEVIHAVTISDGSTPENENFKIQHNLFAYDNPTLPPIKAEADNSTGLVVDSIVRNAFVKGISAFINLAVDQVQTDSNVFLPPGLADYPNSDFPLIQMHTDPGLKSDDANYGVVPQAYILFTSSISNIQSLILAPRSNSGLIFNQFTPNKGFNWGSQALVGCFFHD